MQHMIKELGSKQDQPPLEWGLDINAAVFKDGKRETPNGEVGGGVGGGAAGRRGGGAEARLDGCWGRRCRGAADASLGGRAA
jgi:hypothetical protein